MHNIQYTIHNIIMTLFRTQIMVQLKFNVNLIVLLGVGETGAPRGKPTIDPLLAN